MLCCLKRRKQSCFTLASALLMGHSHENFYRLFSHQKFPFRPLILPHNMLQTVAYKQDIVRSFISMSALTCRDNSQQFPRHHKSHSLIQKTPQNLSHLCQQHHRICTAAHQRHQHHENYLSSVNDTLNSVNDP